LHFGHSNSRSSRPSPAGDIRASIIKVWHFEHRGRSIALSGDIFGVPSVMTRFSFWRGCNNLTVTGGCLDRTAISKVTKAGTPVSVRYRTEPCNFAAGEEHSRQMQVIGLEVFPPKLPKLKARPVPPPSGLFRNSDIRHPLRMGAMRARAFVSILYP
jgi:hypothetical protein